jgi:hypothetical protein
VASTRNAARLREVATGVAGAGSAAFLLSSDGGLETARPQPIRAEKTG